MPRPKGTPKTGGRRAGVKSRQIELRAAILEALARLGGIDWLVDQAKINPALFFNLLKAVIPREVIMENDAQNKEIIINIIDAVASIEKLYG